MRRAMMILLAIGCFLALGATGQAVTVTVNGWRQFDSGGFEADTPPLNPADTLVGGWIVDEALGLLNGTVDVVGPATSGPGAADGTKYLALTKDATLGGYPSAMGVLKYPALTGDSVVADFNLYVDSANNTRISKEGTAVLVDFTKDLSGFINHQHTWLAFCFPDGAVPTAVSSDGWQERQLYVAFYDGKWNNVKTAGGTTNMFVNPDTWLDVELNLTVGSQWTVTIDGVTSDPIAVQAAFATNSVAALQFFNNCASQAGLFYIDGAVNPPLPGLGDANGDGVVDDKDASILGAHWMQQTGVTWANGDFNGDRKVDDLDAAILAAHWTGSGGGDASVPEPGAVALWLGALATLFVGRRLLPLAKKGIAMRHSVLALLAGAGLLLLATDADALVIKSVTWGTTEFDSGGFEGYVVGGDPVPAVAGNWQLYKRSGLINAKTEVAGPGSAGPGANEGNNYLKFEVDTVGANNPTTKGGAIAALANQALTFDQITAEFALYVDSSASTWGAWANYPLMAFVKSTAGLFANRHTWATLTDGGPNWDPLLSSVGREEGQLILAYHDTAWHNVTTGGGTTNMFFDMDSWHDLRFDLTVGSSYTITLDGVTSDPIAIAATLQNTPVAAFQIFTNDTTVKSLYYIDNVSAAESAASSVPEPGTLALVAGGLLSLLVWRRRR